MIRSVTFFGLKLLSKRKELLTKQLWNIPCNRSLYRQYVLCATIYIYIYILVNFRSVNTKVIYICGNILGFRIIKPYVTASVQ